MLQYLFRQLVNSCGIFLRTIRAFFTRKMAGGVAGLRRATNFSRKATKVATSAFQGAAAAVQKPTRREDYVETQRLFISKSFLLLSALGLVLLALFVYFVLWPFLLSRFFTAKFYVNDPKLADWSGRVIVYADEARTVPQYSGRVTDGVLQGKGREFDADGLLAYEGTFADGRRSGHGTAYADGVLVYEGTFSDGTASGQGTAYRDGKRCYEGAFADGVYQGTGTAYDTDGTSVLYQGEFQNGLYEGNGIEYNTKNGKIRYQGGFLAGRYSGAGSRYLDNGDVIRAAFADGETDGAIQWYKSGKLWYDGSAADLTPNGFGTVYGADGKALYSGQFDHGTLDGGWLLSCTAEELRTAFGEAAVTETDGDHGFRIVNRALGAAVLCSYRQAEQDAQAYQVWFQPQGKFASLLPWKTAADFETWAKTDKDAERTEQLTAPTVTLDGRYDGAWAQTRCHYADYTCAGLVRTGGQAPVRLVWYRENAPLPSGLDAVSAEPSEAQTRLSDLMDALSGTAVPDGGQASQDAADLLSQAADASHAETLVQTMAEWFVRQETAAVLAEESALLEQTLAEAQSSQERGDTGSQETVDALTERKTALERRSVQTNVRMEQAALTVQTLTGSRPDGFHLQGALVCFDPASLDAQALLDAACAYARGISSDGTADSEALTASVKTAVLELELLYQDVLYAGQSAEQAAEQADAAAASLAKGQSSEADFREAQTAQMEASIARLEAFGSFTKQAAALNTLSGGWLADAVSWLNEPFDALFQQELARAEQARQQAALEKQEQEKQQQKSEAVQEPSDTAEPAA